MPPVNIQQRRASAFKGRRPAPRDCLRHPMRVQYAARILPKIDKGRPPFRLILFGAARGDEQSFRKVGAVGKIPAGGIVGYDDQIQRKIALNEGTGLLPG